MVPQRLLLTVSAFTALLALSAVPTMARAEQRTPPPVASQAAASPPPAAAAKAPPAPIRFTLLPKNGGIAFKTDLAATRHEWRGAEHTVHAPLMNGSTLTGSRSYDTFTKGPRSASVARTRDGKTEDTVLVHQVAPGNNQVTVNGTLVAVHPSPRAMVKHANAIVQEWTRSNGGVAVGSR